MGRRGPRGIEMCGIYRSLRVQHKAASGWSEKEEEKRKIANSLPKIVIIIEEILAMICHFSWEGEVRAEWKCAGSTDLCACITNLFPVGRRKKKRREKLPVLCRDYGHN